MRNLIISKFKIRSLTMTSAKDEEYFDTILYYIKKTYGLDCYQYRRSFVRRKIESRMRENHIKTFKEYLQLLKKSKDEHIKLFDAIGVNVTRFFRDYSTFKYLRDVILPSISHEMQQRGLKTFRIWSAGCATGEEAYSMAILLNEIFGEKINEYIISIYGTDIDREALNKAKIGTFDEKSLAETPTHYIKKYFVKISNDKERFGCKYKVKDNVRRLIRFKYHDLTSGKSMGVFNMILCRNVIIYFAKDIRERLFSFFYNSLRDFGYLILGKTEVIPQEVGNLFEPINPEERIYQKISRR